MASRNTTFWTFIVILVALHLGVRTALGFGLIPDLLVVATLLAARRLSPAAASLTGLVLGILADALALVAFGASAVAFVVASFLGSRSRSFFEGESLLFTVVYVFLGAWLIEVIRVLLTGGIARLGGYMVLVTQLPLQALYVAVAAAVAVLAYRAVTGHR